MPVSGRADGELGNRLPGLHDLLDLVALDAPEDEPVPRDPFELPAAGVNLDELERSLVQQALRRAGGNQTKAATLLGLNRDQIRYRIEKFGLTATQ